MRWSEQPPELPLQPLSALSARAAGQIDPPSVADPGVQVIVPRAVREAVVLHLQGSSAEQGGLLLGEVFVDDDAMSIDATRAVMLTNSVPALDFESSAISLRMESGVWERARLKRAPQELIVGWYHSHPGLGAFFSLTDRRTQAAFFPHPYSVGWVIDPIDETEAFFIGRASRAPATVRGGGQPLP
jgi:proteasome lid subunit RPN8/RPN11